MIFIKLEIARARSTVSDRKFTEAGRVVDAVLFKVRGGAKIDL